MQLATNQLYNKENRQYVQCIHDKAVLWTYKIRLNFNGQKIIYINRWMCCEHCILWKYYRHYVQIECNWHWVHISIIMCVVTVFVQFQWRWVSFIRKLRICSLKNIFNYSFFVFLCILYLPVDPSFSVRDTTLYSSMIFSAKCFIEQFVKRLNMKSKVPDSLFFSQKAKLIWFKTQPPGNCLIYIITIWRHHPHLMIPPLLLVPFFFSFLFSHHSVQPHRGHLQVKR